MMKHILLFMLFVSSSCAGFAQNPVFDLVSDSLGVDHTFSQWPIFSGGLSLRDFDHDGWDDILMCTDTSSAPILYKNVYGTFERNTTLLPLSANQENYSVWIDYNNDGYLDCFVLTEMNGASLLKGMSNGAFQDVTSNAGLIFESGFWREGALFCDFNNDGLLDLFVSSYTADTTNSIFFQTPNNTFVNVSELTGACDSLDFTFHAIALDYNEDGWMDFYEANDDHTGNLLFRNNGDSTFTEVSQSTGMYQELDAMGVGIADIDGDLDMDYHITDRLIHSKLLLNNGNGTFSEVATARGIDYVNGFGWGNIFADVDLDGDQDMYLSGNQIPFQVGLPSFLYINDGSGYFSIDTLPGDSLYSFSNGVFDFNNDRRPDLVSLNSNGFEASVWMNKTATNAPRFSLILEGCASNRDAFGAQIIAYDGPDNRLLEVHSSESFQAQSSTRKIIPILNGPTLDSLKVEWPAGGDTILYELLPDQTIKLKECGGAKPYPVILVHDYSDHELTLCPSDTMLLSIDGNYQDLIWSNGATSDSIFVTSGGVYNLTVTNQFGVSGPSSKAVVVNLKEYPSYDVEIEEPNCFNNGSILLNYNVNAQYEFEWNTGSSNDSLTGLTPGSYYLTVTNQGFCAVTDTVDLVGPDSLNPISVSISAEDIACKGDLTQVVAEATGGFGALDYSWSSGMSGAVQQLTAGTHSLTITDINNCQIDTSFILTEPEELFVWVESIPDTNRSNKGKAWVEIDGGTPPYSTMWSDSLDQEGDTAFFLLAGNYNATVLDMHDCELVRNFDVNNQTVDTLLGNKELVKNEIDCSRTESGLLIDGLSFDKSSNQINLLDLQGREVSYNTRQLGSRLEITINRSGLYLVLIKGQTYCLFHNF